MKNSYIIITFSQSESRVTVINNVTNHYQGGINVSGNARLEANAISAGLIAGHVGEINAGVISNGGTITSNNP